MAKNNNYDAQYDRWGDIPGSIRVIKSNQKNSKSQTAQATVKTKTKTKKKK